MVVALAPKLGPKGNASKKRNSPQQPSGSPALRRAAPRRSTNAKTDHCKRIQALLEAKIEFIPSSEFKLASAEKHILGDDHALVRRGLESGPRVASSGRSPYVANLYGLRVLDPKEESELFRRMNFCKFLAAKLRRRLSVEQPVLEQIERVEALLTEATHLRNELVRANLRLVVYIVTRYAAQDEPFGELVSDGNVSLLRAVEKFDYSRGFRFSTYASWAIRRNLTRTRQVRVNQARRFSAGDEQLMQSLPDVRTNERLDTLQRKFLSHSVEGLMAHLDRREKMIVALRFGMDRGCEKRTLQEIADNLGVCKERIRQLERRALKKMRQKAPKALVDWAI